MDEAEEKQQLIKQMGSRENAEALQAVEVLRERGWLMDGLPKGIDLSRADLSGANLKGVNLSGVNLNREAIRKLSIRANVSGINLSDANLSHADLSETHLPFANLSGANLTNADLRGTQLGGADLRMAHFPFANLSGADLSRTRLIRASLDHTDLSGADLTNANLSQASLSHANINGAQLGGTIIVDVDLTTTNGLESIQHRFPSSLGVDTIFRSGGKIPEVFLRGCGIPEILIQYLPSMLGKAIEHYKCFISYSHQDEAFAQRVHDTLQGKGIRCWLDQTRMNPGHNIYDAVDKGIKWAEKVILCASEHSLASWWVQNEIDSAFEKERTAMKQRGDGERVEVLMALDVDGFLFSDEFQSGLKRPIQSSLAANFQGWEHDNALFEREIERVIKALRTDGGKEPPTCI